MQVSETRRRYTASDPIRMLAIGNSNLNALIRAEKKMRQEGRFPESIRMQFMQLRSERYNPNFPPDNELLIKPALRDDLKTYLQGTDIVVSCLGGNNHAVFGLVNHPNPYDFILDGGGPLIEGREIVPASVVRAAMRDHLKRPFDFISAVRALIGKPIIH
jgi:hypothetical protein